MGLNDPTATITALLCACVVITLMFYRRGYSRHRPWVSRLAWLITVTYSAVPFAYLCGIYPPSSWPPTLAITIFLFVPVAVIAYLSRLFVDLQSSLSIPLYL
ncbi:phage holin family protein, partial [Salmonella enterica]|uniref:phage holin family protein n=1 Tax=Salmonella enterica TaxID=28901 RepID=UPI00398C4082